MQTVDMIMYVVHCTADSASETAQSDTRKDIATLYRIYTNSKLLIVEAYQANSARMFWYFDVPDRPDGCLTSAKNSCPLKVGLQVFPFGPD